MADSWIPTVFRLCPYTKFLSLINEKRLDKTGLRPVSRLWQIADFAGPHIARYENYGVRGNRGEP